MRSTSELFGIPEDEVRGFKHLPYYQVLDAKLSYGRLRYRKLAIQLDKMYNGQLKMAPEEASHLNAELKELKDALEHNEFLLKEVTI